MVAPRFPSLLGSRKARNRRAYSTLLSHVSRKPALKEIRKSAWSIRYVGILSRPNTRRLAFLSGS